MTDVVHVISGLGTGGAETMLVQLAAALRERGLSQHVISLGTQDALAPDLRSAGIDVTVLGAASFTKAPAALVSLLRTVNRLRPRFLQGWMYHGNLAATFCHYACRGRSHRKLYWNLRASNMDARRYGRTVRLGSLLSKCPDIIIANSEAGAEFHCATGFKARRLLVIENGIDSDRFCPDPAARSRVRSDLGIADDAVVVIHVARVDPMKDHRIFLAAMQNVPSAIGLMVGEGTTNLVAPPHVRALGLRRDTPALYAAADIVSSTSAFGEGFSNVMAEGMSAGLVPVATDVGDARRIIGDTGFVTPPGDPQAYAAALAKIVVLSKTERMARGLAARRRIVSNFTIAKAAEAFAALYKAD
jgi:glycosyltransferase involved in cell wall biosynthesis